MPTSIQNKWQITETKTGNYYDHDDCIMPFLDRTSLLCLTYLFNVGLLREIYIASKVFRFRLI